MNGATGDIMSPNYTHSYEDADCYWKIAVAAGNWIRLIIVDIDLIHHTNCRLDYIELYEDVNPRNRQRYCSQPYSNVVETNSNTLNVRLYADYLSTGRGFHLKYETGESCAYHSGPFELSGAENRADCLYRLFRKVLSVFALTGKIVTNDLLVARWRSPGGFHCCRFRRSSSET